MNEKYSIWLKALTYETLHSYFILSPVHKFIKKLKYNDLIFLIFSNSLIRKLISIINDGEIVTKSFNEVLYSMNDFIAEWSVIDPKMKSNFNENKYLNTLTDLAMILTDYKTIEQILNDFENNLSFSNFKDIDILFE